MKSTNSYDVIVIGGGTAGISAALSAARTGAKTLLAEATYLLGGLASAGLVTYYLPLCDGDGTQLCRGIAEELLLLAVSEGSESPIPEAWRRGGTKAERRKKRYEAQFNPYMFAFLAERLLSENGVDILYGGMLSKTHKNKQGNKIAEIDVTTRAETLSFTAKSFVDCTGDATLCAYAGEDTALSERGNVLAAWYYETRGGEYMLNMRGSKDNVYSLPLGEKKTFVGLGAEELSRVTKISHETVLNDFLKNGEVSRTHALAAVSMIPQVRMTRRLCGAANLRKSDDGKLISASAGTFGSWKSRGPAYELPMGALYGRKIKNLFAAGRCVSVEDDEMWDIARVIPVCAVTGEAAGVMAALYGDTGEIEPEKVQSTLVSRGVKVHIEDCRKEKNE